MNAVMSFAICSSLIGVPLARSDESRFVGAKRCIILYVLARNVCLSGVFVMFPLALRPVLISWDLVPGR
jgi:hypothetical protein